MMVLVTYDVNTESPAGQARLRKVAKICEDYGRRVQNSVFECLIDAAQLKVLKARLSEVINPEKDSLRFYVLGNHWRGKIEHMGAKKPIDLEGPLMV